MVMMQGLCKCSLILLVLSLYHISLSKSSYTAGEGDYDNLNAFEQRAVKSSNGQQNLTWIAGKSGQNPPEGAFVVGYSSNKRPIYLGRVTYAGNQLPAKVTASVNYVGTLYKGVEYSMESYEALCYGHLAWIPFNGEIPNNALVLGKMTSGENVYVGRGMYKGNLEPGMVLPSEKVLYLPNAGKARRISNFELLIDLDHKKGLDDDCPAIQEF